jgi:hypothetical protein
MNPENKFRGLEVVKGPERKKGFGEKLNRLVGDIAREENERAERECGIKGLLNEDGSVNMEGFATENGGIYSKEEVGADLAQVYNDEVSNSVSHNLAFGSPEQKARVKEWQKDRSESKSNQVEEAIMVVLYNMLKADFLVVRAAKLDDYEAGVDMFIVNRTTGAVICAIDDVHKEGEDDLKKQEKTKRIALKGGAEVKYGITSHNGQLKRTKLENLPVFYLGLTSDEFNNLMASMGPGLNSAVSGKEVEIFSQFAASLESQKNSIGSLIFEPGAGIRQNIGQLGSSIKKLKQIAHAIQESHFGQLPMAA